MRPAVTPGVWGLAFLLMAMCPLFRGRGLGGLPMLGEEATFIRMAKAMNAQGISSLGAALHGGGGLWPWVLSRLIVTDHPLLAARWVSIGAGALLIPVEMLIWANLTRLMEEDDQGSPATGGTIGLVAALLIGVCPYLAMVQRVAAAESLFLLQGAVCAWLSLRLALGASDRIGPGWMFLRGLLVLAALAAAAETIPARSWSLPLLPAAAALAVIWRSRGGGGVRWGVVLGWAAVATLPMLLVLRMPVLTVNHAAANLKAILVPTLSQLNPIEPTTTLKGEPTWKFNFDLVVDNGWYFVYLTPVVCLLAVLGLLRLWKRARRGVFVFVVGWAVAALLPIILAPPGADTLPGATAAIPLLMAAAFALVDILFNMASSPAPVVVRWVFCLLTAGLSLGWPAIWAQRQGNDWRTGPIMAADLTRRSASGSSWIATRSAYVFLLNQAVDHPIVVLLPEYGSNPCDGLWLLLHKPGLSPLVGAFDVPLRATPDAAPEHGVVHADRYSPGGLLSLTVAEGTGLYLVMPDPVYVPAGPVAADAAAGAGWELVGVFANGNGAHGVQPVDYVRVYQWNPQ